MNAEELVKAGQLDEALAALQAQVRDDPADAKLRIFLFQLLAVLGQWDRALTQLNVAAEMDASAGMMGTIYRSVIQAEVLRGEIFAGTRTPMIFGEPEAWVGWLVQANALAAKGDHDNAAELRDKAFESAPAIPGTVDGQAFEWLADADSRMGPVLEAIVEGKYYWVPMSRVASLTIEPPEDLRDLVWTPARFTWTNGGEAVAMLFARYPGSESADNPALRLARATEWIERPGGLFTGVGQRMLATDQGEYAILGVRQVTLDNPEIQAETDQPDTPAQAGGDGG